MEDSEDEVRELEEEDPKITPNPLKSRIRKMFTFGVLCMTILTQNFYFSFPIPFLTHEIVETRKQGTVIGGVVVGVFHLVGSATSLVAGYFASKLTFKKMLWLSGVAYFLTSIVFVIPISNNIVFDMTVISSRVVQGAVLGISEPMIVAVMGSLYKDSLGMVTATYELAFSASLALGPLMGGFLYDLKGFWLPFAVTGTLCLLMNVLVIVALPEKVDEDVDDDEQSETEPCSILKYFRPSIILLGIVVMATVAADEAFVGNFLAVYLKNSYDKEVDVTGTILMVCGIFYSLTTVLFGYLTDKGMSRAVAVISGFLVLTIGTLLMDTTLFGAPWPSFVYPGITYGLVEIGSAMIQVSILPLLVYHDVQQDQERSTEAMTGVYNAGFFLGAFVGPIVGSALLEQLSFSATFVIFAAIMFVVSIIIGVCHLRQKNLLTIKEKRKDKEILLTNFNVEPR